MFEQIIIILICILELLTVINSKERLTQLDVIISDSHGKSYIMSYKMALSILSRSILFPFVYTCCVYFLFMNTSYFDNHALYLTVAILNFITIYFNPKYSNLSIKNKALVLRVYSITSVIIWFPAIISIIKIIY